jgi:hypothetical protein
VVHILSEVEDVHWILGVSEEAFTCIQMKVIISVSVVLTIVQGISTFTS